MIPDAAVGVLFNDELEAMRGEDSEPEDGGLIGDTSQFRVGVA